ncbi:pyroglutamyl-peptidase 1-like [Centruroides sculpturatus]|uniref:pyroglutamyl-peptidase 1-like n=1 Tax=Centruroides sculpturatus TaxID=218467 RepID=UPI000C6E3C2A|nr:pyroglutamyl-peptidase 1-like [Centruroides sculpturatus]XP_023219840.1 pyroglutamyl-peptidase 1-like [Centruroides sculpturatus]
MDCENDIELNSTFDVNQPNIIITGFGPFRDIEVNSSWIAVRELAKVGIDGVNLIIKEIPVEYETVTKIIPELWKKYKPAMVVHCGVSSSAKTLVLEQLAHNNGYESPDVTGNLPPSSCCVKCGSKCLQTKIDMYQVSHDVNSSGLQIPAVVSNDAGRYLCEFIYYTSLNVSPATAFIHVPPVDQPFSVEQLAQGIKVAISSMIKQLNLLPVYK